MAYRCVRTLAIVLSLAAHFYGESNAGAACSNVGLLWLRNPCDGAFISPSTEKILKDRCDVHIQPLLHQLWSLGMCVLRNPVTQADGKDVKCGNCTANRVKFSKNTALNKTQSISAYVLQWSCTWLGSGGSHPRVDQRFSYVGRSRS